MLLSEKKTLPPFTVMVPWFKTTYQEFPFAMSDFFSSSYLLASRLRVKLPLFSTKVPLFTTAPFWWDVLSMVPVFATLESITVRVAPFSTVTV